MKTETGVRFPMNLCLILKKVSKIQRNFGVEYVILKNAATATSSKFKLQAGQEKPKQSEPDKHQS